jgi:ferritin-like metal-binding protein YciE
LAWLPLINPRSRFIVAVNARDPQRRIVHWEVHWEGEGCGKSTKCPMVELVPSERSARSRRGAKAASPKEPMLRQGRSNSTGRQTRIKRTTLMGLFSKDIQTMDDLLLHGLQDIYYAENQIVKSLPNMIDKATNRELSKGLKDHLEETRNQIARLDQVFQKLGEPPRGVKCPAIDGLITEADELAGEVADKEVLDAAIVGAAQAVEHYEIARYGTLIAWAESLGRDDVIRLLTTNLNEEKAADKKLSTVAVRKGVNRKAAS